VTICTQNRVCLFGEIVGNEMRLNAAGQMICRWYQELEKKFPNIECDAFVCMPNHVHFIVLNAGINVGTDLYVRPKSVQQQNGQTHRSAPTTETNMGQQQGEDADLHIPRVVQWFKTMTTNEYIRGVKKNTWSPFSGKFWQRNYWEHIVRNEQELNRIQEYIQNNPTQWQLDKLFVGADLRVRP
jgi:REP element-mobilizing transposase RayT